MFKPGAWPRAVFRWADKRLDLTSILARARKKRVPEHSHSHWYYWGGLCLCLVLVQAATGVLLMVYYRPGPDAYESVRLIARQVQYGWLIRSIHVWSAHLMIGAAMVHMASVFFMKAYRRPREFGWWTGLALFGLCLAFGFTGYLLPMDRLAFFATRLGLAIPETVPGMKPLVSALLRGGPDVSATTLQRFFTLHVAVFPALFMLFLWIHLRLIQKHGNALPPGEESKPPSARCSVPFFPDFALREAAAWLGALNLVVLLAALFPWPLGAQADPLKPAPAGIHPEWYFMGLFEALKLLGRVVSGTAGECVALGSIALGIAFAVLVPLFDASAGMQSRARFATRLGLLIFIALIALTAAGYIELL